MRSKILRTTIFTLHRWLGLFAGLILVIVGITGSLLVFRQEWDDWLVRWRFGTVAAATPPLDIQLLVATVKTTYANVQGAIPSYVSIPTNPATPYTIGLQIGEIYREVFVNPVTNKILGDRQWETSIVGRLFEIHIRILSGDTGAIVVGIAALLLLILSITGLFLWPGWRNFISGFKIKFKAHPKRTNFDIHKVTGIITIAFLAMIAFTGFCWNFHAQSEPIIHALTNSPPPPTPVSKPIAGKTALPLNTLLQAANTALPGTRTTFISIPNQPTSAWMSIQVFPTESVEAARQTRIYLDRYSGKVLYLKDARKASLGDRILNWFHPLHYGTFGGLLTRILYVFVGLAPVVLLSTGLVMWKHRQKVKT
ncbi:PepSY-associated TM helix domain-containing protein [Chamaesiphon sp. VAR_48_metabat_403]|uniref:PepSY-associated TM helix domain-containing protein n=1 Tax=Chamaesiphon sp. VAR_48_metabat_403 TaxID=2964700 RepID=UPI00286DD136|nr:PepSY-associated TM helix domain-containing protein [Chamaesiphon sp. VAR_48_metabat_403]